MKRRVLMMVSAVCMVSVMSHGVVYTDTFDVAQDYATDLSGTIWDGVAINSGVSGTQNGVLNGLETSSVPGALTMASVSTNWENADDDGVLLYKNVAAGENFDMSVQLVGGTFESFAGNVYYHSAGLMVRGSDASAVDWAALFGFDHAHDWGFSHILRSTDAGVNSQETLGTAALAAAPWMRLTRTGSILTAYISADGVAWTQAGASIDRADLAGDVQVGIAQASFNDVDGVVAEFDNFSLEVVPEPATMALLGLGSLMAVRRKRVK